MNTPRTPWITEAERFHELSEDFIFVNTAIRDFLDADRIFFVISSKGMGKTLLLRYKRKLLERQKDIYLLPIGKDLDYIHLPKNLAVSVEDTLKDRHFWKDLWEVCITLCVLQNTQIGSEQHRLDTLDLIKRLQLPLELDALLTSKSQGSISRLQAPSEYLAQFLNLPLGHLQRLRRYTAQSIYQGYVHLVQSGTYIFIDSFDQCLRAAFPDDKDIWCAGQIGLLLAAWEMSRHNPHIKVYTSIRQEAFASLHDENRMAMKGSILLLKYRVRELESMIDKCAAYFDKSKPSLAAAVGLSTVRNDYVEDDEPIFSYLYRHTFGTPRALMVAVRDVLHAIDANSAPDKRQSQLRHTVNESMAKEIAQDYIENEMDLFLGALREKHQLERLLEMCKHNVLTLNMLKWICCAYNNNSCDLKCDTCALLHPFCELYNIGLLGIIQKDLSNNKKIQIFRKPYEFEWTLSGLLPKSPYYLLHPAIQPLMREQNEDHQPEHLLIGDGYEWTAKHDAILDQRVLQLFVSYSHADRSEVDLILERLESQLFQRNALFNIWIDNSKLRAGDDVQNTITKALEKADFLLLFVSKASLTSKWVEIEWNTALQTELANNKVKVIPILLDSAIHTKDLPPFLRNKQHRTLEVNDPNHILTETQRLCRDLLAHQAGEQR